MNNKIEKINKIDPEILSHVINAIVGGLNYKLMVDYLQKKGIDIKSIDIGSYLIKAHEYIYRKAEIDKDYELGMALERLNNLYMYCFTSKDYKTCLQVQKEINELCKFENKTQNPKKKKIEEITDFEIDTSEYTEDSDGE